MDHFEVRLFPFFDDAASSLSSPQLSRFLSADLILLISSFNLVLYLSLNALLLSQNRETDVLTEVLSIVKNTSPLPPPPSPKQKDPAPLFPPPAAPLSDQSRRLAREILKRSRLAAAAGRGRSTFGTLVVMASLQGMVIGVWWLLFRRRGGFLGFGGWRKDIKTI